ncbi:MAG: branched-chain amino acid ABC transporter permease [bacterium]|nr:branched-chain amino acid ABC transporter permease [bacterium]
MQIILNGLIVGSAYALMGIGFSLIYSTVRYFNLAYGMVAVIGAYVAYTLMNSWSLNYVIAMLAGALVAVLIGMLSSSILFKPMVRRGGSSLVILVASFGLLIILQNISALIWQNTTRALSISDRILPGYNLFGLIITPNQLMIGAVALLMMLILELFLKKTRYGMAIRAIGDNQELTKVLGLKTEQIILAVYVIGTFISAISATLIALEIGIRPTHGVTLVIKAIIAAIIGGLGSIRGALLGGLLLGVAENLGIYFLGGQWQDTVAFTLLAVFLLVRPEGLFAKKRLVSVN